MSSWPGPYIEDAIHDCFCYGKGIPRTFFLALVDYYGKHWREQIEIHLEMYDEEEDGSWRDYRNAFWRYLPDPPPEIQDLYDENDVLVDDVELERIIEARLEKERREAMTADAQQAPKWEAIRQETLDIVNKWKTKYAEEKPSGLLATLMFVFSFLFSAVEDFVELVEVSAAVVKEDKKETVCEAFKFAYEQVNPDLPWIPEPFETKLETWILDSAMPRFIDWLVGFLNKKGIFTHEGDTAVVEPPQSELEE